MDNNQNNQNDYYNQPYSQPTYTQQAYSQQPTNSAPAASQGLALAAMICGIAGFFTGPGVSIAALVLANIFKNKNNGQHISKSNVGFKCGLISLILWGVGFVLYFILIILIAIAEQM